MKIRSLSLSQALESLFSILVCLRVRWEPPEVCLSVENSYNNWPEACISCELSPLKPSDWAERLRLIRLDCLLVRQSTLLRCRTLILISRLIVSQRRDMIVASLPLAHHLHQRVQTFSRLPCSNRLEWNDNSSEFGSLIVLAADWESKLERDGKQRGWYCELAEVICILCVEWCFINGYLIFVCIEHVN